MHVDAKKATYACIFTDITKRKTYRNLAKIRSVNESVKNQDPIHKSLSYHIYRPLRSGRIWHKVNFLSGVLQVWIQSFPSPRLIALPRLKNLVCPTIYP